LNHNDRIVFGTSSIFLVKIPSKAMETSGEPIEYDWEYAQKELMAKVNKEKNGRFEQSEQGILIIYIYI
jgi:hypothetical protein